MDFATLTQVIRDSGVIGLLAFALYSVIRGWWVPGDEYRRILAERDYWQRRAVGNGTTPATEQAKGENQSGTV